MKASRIRGKTLTLIRELPDGRDPEISGRVEFGPEVSGWNLELGIYFFWINNIVQEIITYLILIVVFGLTGLKLYRLVLSFYKKKQDLANGKCGSCSTGCEQKDLQTGQPDCPTGPAKTNCLL